MKCNRLDVFNNILLNIVFNTSLLTKVFLKWRLRKTVHYFTIFYYYEAFIVTKVNALDIMWNRELLMA